MNIQVDVSKANEKGICHAISAHHRDVHLVQGENNAQCCCTLRKRFLELLVNTITMQKQDTKDLDAPSVVST